MTVYNYVGYRLLGPPFHLPRAVVGIVFTAYLAGSAGSAVAGRLADRVGARRALWMAGAVNIGGLALMLVRAVPLLAAGLLLVTAGFFGAHAVASGRVSRRAGTSGCAPAVYLVGYYLGSSVGGSLGGVAYAHGGWSATVSYVGGLDLLALATGPSLRTPRWVTTRATRSTSAKRSAPRRTPPSHQRPRWRRWGYEGVTST